MFKRLIFLFFILLVFSSKNTLAQSFFENDSVFNKKRTIATSSFLTLGWTSSIAVLSSVWYEEDKQNFHFFDDSKNWLQMDKAGHIFAASHLTQRGTELFRWSGLEKKKSLLLGSVFGFGFQTSFEILDGYASSYGFSWSDVGANAIGTGWYAGQDLLWNEQKIKLKFSAHLTEFADIRPNVLGSTFSERILKDYNGQTYWLSFSPVTFIKGNTKFPKWINISLGYGTNEQLFGDTSLENLVDSNFAAYRRCFLSLDIDLENLPVKKPWLKALLKQVNTLKIPFPTLEFSKDGVKAYGLYF